MRGGRIERATEMTVRYLTSTPRKREVRHPQDNGIIQVSLSNLVKLKCRETYDYRDTRAHYALPFATECIDLCVTAIG